ncbi:MAG: tetratricopeptide repeat protein [Pseudomonadota bacterium]
MRKLTMMVVCGLLMVTTACTRPSQTALHTNSSTENPQTWFERGLQYEKGDGVEQDYDQAVYWYRKAAEQGFAIAQSNLGWMYEVEKGVVRNYAQAPHWYRKAAKQGNALAQNNLGLMYDQGRGVVKSDQTAYLWFALAAAHGNESAQKTISILERRMSQADIAEAQERAQRCLDSSYQDC